MNKDDFFKMRPKFVAWSAYFQLISLSAMIAKDFTNYPTITQMVSTFSGAMAGMLIAESQCFIKWQIFYAMMYFISAIVPFAVATALAQDPSKPFYLVSVAFISLIAVVGYFYLWLKDLARKNWVHGLCLNLEADKIRNAFVSDEEMLAATNEWNYVTFVKPEHRSAIQ